VNSCTRGTLCRFAHGLSELQRLPQDGIVAAEMASLGTWERQVQLAEHYQFGSLPPRTGGEANQNVRPILGSEQQMLPPERDAHMHLEASCRVIQATFAKDRQDTQTTLASYQQDTLTSLATYHEDGEDIFHKEEPVRQRNASSWQQDGYWQQQGLNVRRGCPATLASYRQDTLTSLATYHEDEEEEEEEEEVEEEEEDMFHEWQRDASYWQQDGYWQQGGLNVQPGCPVNCEICRFGAHL